MPDFRGRQADAIYVDEAKEFEKALSNMTHSTTHLDWLISPKIERYRVLGLGETHPQIEGSFIIPIRTMNEFLSSHGDIHYRTRRCHIITRRFSSYGRGRAKVAAAVTALGKDGAIDSPFYSEVWKIANRLTNARAPATGKFHVGPNRNEIYNAGDLLPSCALRNEGAIQVVADGVAHNEVGLENVLESAAEIFGGLALPECAAFVFCNAMSLMEIKPYVDSRRDY